MKARGNKIFMGVAGAALIVLGTICICNPGATLLSIAWLIGIATLVTGISTFGLWIRTRNLMPASGTVLVSAIIQILLGLAFLNNRLMAAVLPVMLGIWMLIEGISVVVRSTDYKAAGARTWWLTCIVGIALGALGLEVLFDPIMTGGALVSVIIGIGIIILGVIDLLAIIGVRIFQKRNRDPWRMDDSIDEQ